MINALTIFLSALLLFLVQPLMGKVILPWFGGGAAVWSAAMLFFQVLLLAGYAYSHFIVSRLDRRKQVAVHLAMVGASVAWLVVTAMAWDSPLKPGSAWKPPDSSNPIGRILLVLSASVGLPYFVLSASGPLLQAWTDAQPAGKSVYRLYALSNLGSLLALVGYPVLFEPSFAVRDQAYLWTVGYAGFVAGTVMIGLRLRRASEETGAVRDRPEQKRAKARSQGTKLHLCNMLLWIGLSACATLLLVAATNEMTQNVAPVPLLWIVPLALYLLSFIICFGRPAWYGRGFGVLFFVASIGSLGLLARGNFGSLLVQVGIHALTLFAACMLCHGELVRFRPDAEHLTIFYLMVSLGGALGSAFVNLVAPVIFNNYWEYPLGLLFCWVLFAIAIQWDTHVTVQRGQRQAQAVLVALLVTGVGTLSYVRAFKQSTVVAERNFYGGLRVQAREMELPYGTIYRLIHGTTIHGLQYEALGAQPTSYFIPSSGIGLALQRVNERVEGQRVGVLGLGIGTLAAYGRAQDLGRPADVYRFYEINPQVIRFAEGEGGYFSYLRDTLPQIEVVEGDARLSLEHELARGERQWFDALILDVFSGDAMPLHLLTRESFDVYLAHTATDGLIAVNISTTHVDLEPVLARLADYFGLYAVVVEDMGEGEPCCASRWTLLARDAAFLRDAAIAARGRPLHEDADVVLWTDDYSNLWQILR